MVYLDNLAGSTTKQASPFLKMRPRLWCAFWTLKIEFNLWRSYLTLTWAKGNLIYPRPLTISWNNAAELLTSSERGWDQVVVPLGQKSSSLDWLIKVQYISRWRKLFLECIPQI